jgi:hypothetical protein
VAIAVPLTVFVLVAAPLLDPVDPEVALSAGLPASVVV